MGNLNSSKAIDGKSFILGMVTAFAECVANECKKAALSPPFYPHDYEGVRSEAEVIAAEQQIYLWYEENRDIPQPRRLNWFVLYKFPEVLEEYLVLRQQGYNPAWHLEKFSDLLSYGIIWGHGSEKVAARMREMRSKKETVARILLTPEDWPIAR